MTFMLLSQFPCDQTNTALFQYTFRSQIHIMFGWMTVKPIQIALFLKLFYHIAIHIYQSKGYCYSACFSNDQLEKYTIFRVINKDINYLHLSAFVVQYTTYIYFSRVSTWLLLQRFNTQKPIMKNKSHYTPLSINLMKSPVAQIKSVTWSYGMSNMMLSRDVVSSGMIEFAAVVHIKMSMKDCLWWNCMA